MFGRDHDLDHTQILLISGHDGANGRIELSGDGQAMIHWPELKDNPYRKLAQSELERFTAALGGKYRKTLMLRGRPGTVHPLGGCAVSSNARGGVVNHRGQVFDAHAGGDVDASTHQHCVHEGLYVADGAVLPSAIGVNPFLTISAMAERTAGMLTSEPAYQDLFAA